jgi:hypothetical protein
VRSKRRMASLSMLYVLQVSRPCASWIMGRSLRKGGSAHARCSRQAGVAQPPVGERRDNAQGTLRTRVAVGVQQPGEGLVQVVEGHPPTVEREQVRASSELRLRTLLRSMGLC